ncbi:MAG: HNH endonuclease [Cetobacterium sp.]
MTNGIKQWPRDPNLPKIVIKLANYKCEYNEEHITFISGSTKQQYMEAHHLIPMNSQDSFKNSLDVLGNIVSLCPNCHRMIHHGDENCKNIIIEKLYNEKQKDLQKFGLEITLEAMKKIYK